MDFGGKDKGKVVKGEKKNKRICNESFSSESSRKKALVAMKENLILVPIISTVTPLESGQLQFIEPITGALMGGYSRFNCG